MLKIRHKDSKNKVIWNETVLFLGGLPSLSPLTCPMEGYWTTTRRRRGLDLLWTSAAGETASGPSLCFLFFFLPFLLVHKETKTAY